MAVHLIPALEEQLQHLAARSNSTADKLAQTALEDFVASRYDLNEAVKRGDADIAAGRVLDHEKSLLVSTCCYKANEGPLD